MYNPHRVLLYKINVFPSVFTFLRYPPEGTRVFIPESTGNFIPVGIRLRQDCTLYFTAFRLMLQYLL